MTKQTKKITDTKVAMFTAGMNLNDYYQGLSKTELKLVDSSKTLAFLPFGVYQSRASMKKGLAKQIKSALTPDEILHLADKHNECIHFAEFNSAGEQLKTGVFAIDKILNLKTVQKQSDRLHDKKQKKYETDLKLARKFAKVILNLNAVMSLANALNRSISQCYVVDLNVMKKAYQSDLKIVNKLENLENQGIDLDDPDIYTKYQANLRLCNKNHISYADPQRCIDEIESLKKDSDNNFAIALINDVWNNDNSNVTLVGLSKNLLSDLSSVQMSAVDLNVYDVPFESMDAFPEDSYGDSDWRPYTIEPDE